MRFRSISGRIEIASGEKLMVLRRRDGSGIPLVKLREVDDLMHGFGRLRPLLKDK